MFLLALLSQTHPTAQSNWLVKSDGPVEPTVQVKLEHVWAHGPPVGSVKFSPDGKYLAAGLGRGGEKTYIYDVNTRRKIWLIGTFIW